MKKVAVFAGTIKDTEMGVEIARGLGFEILEYPFSKTPEEQTKMQYFSRRELNEIFEERVRESISLGAEKIFVYCNSLSLSVDYEEISRKLGINIITPLKTYKNISAKNLAIIAANGFSAYALDKLINENVELNSSITFGNMPLVRSIERADKREDIVKDLALDKFIEYIQSIEGDFKIDTLLLGCTHFSYLTEILKEMTSLKVIDPTEDMIKELMS